MKIDSDKLLKLTFTLVFCQLAGAISSFFSQEGIKYWYLLLKKPVFTPPNWLFGPVWALLYLLMGISLFLVWDKKAQIQNEILGEEKWKKRLNKFSQKFWKGPFKKINVYLIFFVQWFLNILWSVIFFGFQKPGLAFFEILMLWWAVVFVLVNFYRISKIAFYLMIPYFIWVSYAVLLNYYFWILNL